MSTLEINTQFIEELKAEHKNLKKDHTSFVELLTETNKKLDMLIEIMDSMRSKPLDGAM
ncbi:MAG: hypothetical protein QM487_00320 [Candidatus Marithrix sp.]